MLATSDKGQETREKGFRRLEVWKKADELREKKRFYEIARGNNRNLWTHEGIPIEIPSTCTSFSDCGIFLECLESDSK